MPEAVEVDGNLYPVHTSFKFWLTFQKNLKNKNTPPADFDFMYTGDKPRDKNDYKSMRIISDELYASLIKELAKNETVRIFQQLLFAEKTETANETESKNEQNNDTGGKE